METETGRLAMRNAPNVQSNIPISVSPATPAAAPRSATVHVVHCTRFDPDRSSHRFCKRHVEGRPHPRRRREHSLKIGTVLNGIKTIPVSVSLRKGACTGIRTPSDRQCLGSVSEAPRGHAQRVMQTSSHAEGARTGQRVTPFEVKHAPARPWRASVFQLYGSTPRLGIPPPPTVAPSPVILHLSARFILLTKSFTRTAVGSLGIPITTSNARACQRRNGVLPCGGALERRHGDTGGMRRAHQCLGVSTVR